jgi:flagellar protein FliS
MSYGLATARYVTDATETVSQERLLVMLYDRLAADLNISAAAIASGDHAAAGKRLGNAISIILELQATLNVEIWSGGQALHDIYTWLISELMKARIRGEAERVAACVELVTPLRDAWHEAYTLAVGRGTSGSRIG